MPNDSKMGTDSPVWRNDLDVLQLRTLIAHDWDDHIRQLRRSLAFHGETAVNRLSDPALLECAVRLVQTRRLHVVRRANGLGVQFLTSRPVSPTLRRGRLSAEPLAPLELELAAAVSRVYPEIRFPLVVALTYHSKECGFGRLAPIPKFKWQNIATGRETRRSGEIGSNDASFNSVRRKEMRVGEYNLEFQMPEFKLLAIKPPRA